MSHEVQQQPWIENNWQWLVIAFGVGFVCVLLFLYPGGARPFGWY